MDQPAQIPFAVDTDITPLQGRFFESVTKNVSDSRLRSQLYDKVRSTFGGIQQARNIQKAKLQEDEDRSIGLELRRAQLDQSKMELGLARDKVRQQQNAVAKTQEFNTAFDELGYELEGLDPEEAKKKLNIFGAQYADVVTYNPAAKAKLELTNNAFETKRQSRDMPLSFISDLATINDDKKAEDIMPGITSRPEYQASKVVASQKQEALKVKQVLASNIASSGTAEKLADNLSKDVSSIIDDGTAPNWSMLDTSLKELDKLGYISQEQRAKLLEYGINPLKTTKDVAKVKGKKTSKEGFSILRDISSEAYVKAIGAKARSSADIDLIPSDTKKPVADEPSLYD